MDPRALRHKRTRCLKGERKSDDDSLVQLQGKNRKDFLEHTERLISESGVPSGAWGSEEWDHLFPVALVQHFPGFGVLQRFFETWCFVGLLPKDANRAKASLCSQALCDDVLYPVLDALERSLLDGEPGVPAAVDQIVDTAMPKIHDFMSGWHGKAHLLLSFVALMGAKPHPLHNRSIAGMVLRLSGGVLIATKSQTFTLTQPPDLTADNASINKLGGFLSGQFWENTAFFQLCGRGCFKLTERALQIFERLTPAGTAAYLAVQAIPSLRGLPDHLEVIEPIQAIEGQTLTAMKSLAQDLSAELRLEFKPFKRRSGSRRQPVPAATAGVQDTRARTSVGDGQATAHPASAVEGCAEDAYLDGEAADLDGEAADLDGDLAGLDPEEHAALADITALPDNVQQDLMKRVRQSELEEVHQICSGKPLPSWSQPAPMWTADAPCDYGAPAGEGTGGSPARNLTQMRAGPLGNTQGVRLIDEYYGMQLTQMFSQAPAGRDSQVVAGQEESAAAPADPAGTSGLLRSSWSSPPHPQAAPAVGLVQPAAATRSMDAPGITSPDPPQGPDASGWVAGVHVAADATVPRLPSQVLHRAPPAPGPSSPDAPRLSAGGWMFDKALDDLRLEKASRIKRPEVVEKMKVEMKLKRALGSPAQQSPFSKALTPPLKQAALGGPLAPRSLRGDVDAVNIELDAMQAKNDELLKDLHRERELVQQKSEEAAEAKATALSLSNEAETLRRHCQGLQAANQDLQARNAYLETFCVIPNSQGSV
ncbi:hypothetical protein WJX73_003744 [Symbiochloris irregularis]|uniref:Uncharacterized protein n=1 Tax=Symbiochloris irregularis TaxID=706552 RepID=A0AAW1NUM3_9CHLO